jgi:hypothetical protein
LNSQQKLAILQDEYFSLYLAIYHHRTHRNKPLTFIGLPYLIDIYKDNSDKKVLIKSTQSGISEYLIIEAIKKTFHEKRNVFYVMPTDKLKNQFVNTRFEQSVEYTKLYSKIFKESSYNNKSVKQVGNASIFFAVSNSRNNFTSFPADDLIIDELDECNLENVEMANERLAFSDSPKEIRVANPTYPDLGIDYEWNKSDKKRWFLTCSCGHTFTPDFFKNVVREEKKNDFVILDKEFDFESNKDIDLICDKCYRPVNRYEKGEWIKEKASPVSGRQLNQLFSSKRKLRDIVLQFTEALPNEIKMQRFYNGTLGQAYIGRGAQINDDIISSCVSDYMLPITCKETCVIGIDVGKRLHTVIFALTNLDGRLKMRLVFAGELVFTVTKDKIDVSELVDLFSRYNIKAGLIDAAPEFRLSQMIAASFKQIWRCQYLTENPRDLLDKKTKVFKTDRTASMDAVKEQMILTNLLLPKDIDRINDFKEHLKAPIRIYQEKETTNGRWVWREGNKPDHYFHAVNYANIAKRLLLAT